MKMLRQLIGLLLITLAWIDPFSLGMEFQVLFFILGFDLTNLIFKAGIFVLDMVLDISGMSWYLILLVVAEALIYFLKLKKFVGYLVKPLVVFVIIFANGLGWELGIIIAGIDLLLNYTKKYI